MGSNIPSQVASDSSTAASFHPPLGCCLSRAAPTVARVAAVGCRAVTAGSRAANGGWSSSRVVGVFVL